MSGVAASLDNILAVFNSVVRSPLDRSKEEALPKAESVMLRAMLIVLLSGPPNSELRAITPPGVGPNNRASSNSALYEGIFRACSVMNCPALVSPALRIPAETTGADMSAASFRPAPATFTTGRATAAAPLTTGFATAFVTGLTVATFTTGTAALAKRPIPAASTPNLNLFSNLRPASSLPVRP